MKYYMIKVVRVSGRRWHLSCFKNHDDERTFLIETPFGKIGFIFDSGNGHAVHIYKGLK